ncbi:dihydroxyacetone kinase subunit DhaL [Haloimpatiens sp. FM7330]|uniref:dihydroxyacetone kinase subunit DhaL n=1 Tax=Haloimpatiens sp. FM7330 TaxID=3298610 RepID=UPI0036395720
MNTLKPKEVKELLLVLSKVFQEKMEELSEYDSVIGDGDHGVTMARGFKAGAEKISDLDEDVNGYFKKFGRALIAELGGAIGPLFGSVFTEIAKACKGEEEIGLCNIVNGFEGAQNKIMELGGAKVGDKTMVDAIAPTVESLKESLKNNLSLKEAMELAEKKADEGVKSTIPLIAKRGRSKFLQEKAIGHQDAGATSFYYLIKTFNKYIDK